MKYDLLRAAAKKRAQATGDPLFSDVLLLSNYDTDASDVMGHPITLSNGASVSGGMLQLDGINDLMETTAFEVVTDPVCIEGFFTLNNWGGTATNGTAIESVWDARVPNIPGMVFYRSGNNITLHINGIDRISVETPAYTNGTEVHVAVQVDQISDVCYATVWWNGSRIASVNFALGPYQFIDRRIRFGPSNAGLYALDGKVSALRITKGVRYDRADTSIDIPALPFPETGRIYARWNPSDANLAYTINANGTVQKTGGDANVSLRATQPKTTGKWYYELEFPDGLFGGDGAVCLAAFDAQVLDTYPGGTPNSILMAPSNNYTAADFAFGTPLTTFIPNVASICSVAIDFAARKAWVRVNGTWNGDPVAGTDPAITWASSFPICIAQRLYYNTYRCVLNTGGKPFTYSVPAGFNEGWYEE